MDRAPESKLYYYRARYYNPELGIFQSHDPLGYIDSMNMYAYCGNNPTNFVDPYGENFIGGMISMFAGNRFDPSVDMGMDEVGQVSKEFGKGTIDGSIIVADAYTFGLIGPLNRLADEKVCENGKLGKASRVAAVVSREAAVAALGIKGGAIFEKAMAARKTVTVTRWGSEGLKSGDYVVRGGKNLYNFGKTLKWIPGGSRAAYSGGTSYSVSGSTLKTVGGFFDDLHTAMGHFIYGGV